MLPLVGGRLLELYYADKISPELFADEERRITEAAALATQEDERTALASRQSAEVAARFDEVAELLGALDAATTWQTATRDEQRVLVHELLEELAIFPDHLEVALAGVPRLNVTLEEVGVQFCGVRGGT